jgi:hypothetical protein
MMQRRQFAHYPAMNGLGYGFWEHVENGRRAISHDGGWQGFYSDMFLLPEENVGVFIAANSLSNPPAGDFGNAFVKKFTEYYSPRETAAEAGDRDRTAAPVPSPESSGARSASRRRIPQLAHTTAAHVRIRPGLNPADERAGER